MMTLNAQSDKDMEFMDGIWIEREARQRFYPFEEQYIQVRDKEHRIFSINEIRKLPEVHNDHVHAQEWKLRQRSIERFMNFLDGRKISSALDIGCGTGFFANMLTAHCDAVAGVEVNITELKQAAEAFGSNRKLQWYYADIMGRKVFKEGSFDLITFCCSFQYFPEIKQILDVCFYYLRQGGSVHIIDTPFYQANEQEKARMATRHYYHNMGCDTLAQHYFHHTWDGILPYKPIIHYQKSKQRLRSFFDRPDSPFPWIEIKKP